MKKYSFLLLAAGLFLSACGKDDDEVVKKDDPATPSAVELNFDSRFGSEDFVRNKVYLNKNGDSVLISSFRFFISNVELVKTDGSVHKIPDSYYLIETTDEKVRETVSLPVIPDGEYSKLRFMVGVDSAHNQSYNDAVGDLKQWHHMTWMWNTGYIFLLVNGQYYNPANKQYDGLVYEIGKDHSSRMVELSFPTVTIGSTKNPKFLIYTDVKTVFGGPNTMDVKAEPRVDGTPQQSANSIKVADNYATMFTLKAVKQE